MLSVAGRAAERRRDPVAAALLGYPPGATGDGFGYVTYLSQSTIPAFVAHIAMNVVEPLTDYLCGPIAMGELENSALMLAFILGMMAFAASIYLARNILQEKLKA